MMDTAMNQHTIIDKVFSTFLLEDDTDIDEQVEKLFMRLGLKLRARQLFSSTMYNGKTFNRNLPGRHLLHDLAHWLLAPMLRKSLPDFGLGPGPESYPDGDERIVSGVEQNEEESAAALLGILIQHHMGLPVGEMFDEIYGRGFGESLEDAGNDDNIIRSWNRLLKDNMIDHNGFPRVLL